MDIKTIPTAKLVHILCDVTDQDIINRIAYELTCRIYVPNNGETTFEEMLSSFGYKDIEKENTKQLKRK